MTSISPPLTFSNRLDLFRPMSRAYSDHLEASGPDAGPVMATSKNTASSSLSHSSSPSSSPISSLENSSQENFSPTICVESLIPPNNLFTPDEPLIFVSTPVPIIPHVIMLEREVPSFFTPLIILSLLGATIILTDYIAYDIAEKPAPTTLIYLLRQLNPLIIKICALRLAYLLGKNSP